MGQPSSTYITYNQLAPGAGSDGSRDGDGRWRMQRSVRDMLRRKPTSVFPATPCTNAIAFDHPSNLFQCLIVTLYIQNHGRCCEC
jgi:hypothetical protein